MVRGAFLGKDFLSFQKRLRRHSWLGVRNMHMKSLIVGELSGTMGSSIPTQKMAKTSLHRLCFAESQIRGIVVVRRTPVDPG